MKKAIIYGASCSGKQIAPHVLIDYQLAGFIDSNPEKQGKSFTLEGREYPIYAPEILKSQDFDRVFVGSCDVRGIVSTLHKLGVSDSKIDTKLIEIFETSRVHTRATFINNLATILKEQGVRGSCAELGVHRGDTARHINRVFPESTLYLLDTFEGFDERDCEFEISKGFSTAKKGEFGDTSLDLVKSKMPYLNKVKFIQGYFPQTASQIPDSESFAFVNIDVDLYQPILAGCEFFYPRLTGGGLLLIDDYFNPTYEGTKKAVDEFAKAHNLAPLPIGDSLSVCFVKKEFKHS